MARLKALNVIEALQLVRMLRPEVRDHLLTSWPSWARRGQLWPDEVKTIWLMLAGRGFGKTRAGAEWVRNVAETVFGARIALVGATAADVRSVMIEGASGLMALGDPRFRPTFYPSRGELKWSQTGAVAKVYTAEAPDGLRGPEHHAAWGDEFAKWAQPEETLANLRMGLRLGDEPRLLLTTTPKPSRLLAALVEDPAVVITRGSTFENHALPDGFIAAMQRDYGGTQRGRQELEGELLSEQEGALWTRAMLEALRVRQGSAELRRVVVGVDPPAGGAGPEAAMCGIVVVGLASAGRDGRDRAYVLADMSIGGQSPEGWARQVVLAAERWAADRVIAEVNNGGDMVTAVLRGVAPHLPVRPVRASRGKVARAEPVAALYEAGQVHHVGAMPELEDQMCGLLMGGDYAGPGGSPDRADALVWALTELMLGAKSGVPKVHAL
ncbi:DNA-packaging protein [Pacificimonas sp. WHA3]|uniref:DNA-packaging protein n=2 Tax=Pacificimonas pallii TaxID=2827236 RepID=A0ABS6SA15_9SPHN|nr:DNA-packaging protein [Pacificimonas pallii]